MFTTLQLEMDFLVTMRERMGERYPEAMFLPPVLVDVVEKARMIKAMRVGSKSPSFSCKFLDVALS